MRPVSISLFFLLIWGSLSAQSYVETYNSRDSLINIQIKAENYTAAVDLIEAQLELINSHEIYDSLYHYCYKYGRALTRTLGEEEAIARVKLLVAEVEEKDKNIIHYLQSLNDLTWIYYETGNLQKCYEVDSLYLKICLSNEHLPAEKLSMAYYNLGYDDMEFGKHQQALSNFQSSVDAILLSDEKYPGQLSRSYNALGAVQWHMGFLEDAKKSYQISLELIEHLNDPESILERANIIGNMALIFQDNGEIIKSKEYQEKFIQMDLEALPRIEDPWLRETAMRRITSAYVNLAVIYNILGDYSKSRKLLELAIEERKKILKPDDPSLAGAIENLAFLELRSGNYEQAEIKMNEYLEYCRQYFGENSTKTASAYKEVGILYLDKKEYDKSLAFFDRAIVSQLSSGNPDGDPYLADIYRQRSSLFFQTGESTKALDDLRKSMQIYSKSRSEVNRMFVNIYLEMAEIKLSENEVDFAASDVDQAIEILTEKKNVSQVTPYLMPKAYYLKALIESRMDSSDASLVHALNYLETAIKYLKSNKRSYMDEDSKLMLYDAHKKIFELAEGLTFTLYHHTGDEKWIEAFFSLSEENRTILLRSRLQNFSALDYAGIPDSILQKERELEFALGSENEDLHAMMNVVDLERQFEALIIHIQEKYPEYYALKYAGKSYSIHEVQKYLLDDDISLMSYSLTEDYIYVLILDKTSEQLFRIETGNVKPDILNMNQALIQGDHEVFDSLSGVLYQSLFKPFQPFLGNDELVIVPDDELFFLNFEILPDQMADSAGSMHKMLIHRFTISYYLSTTVSMQFKGLKEDGPGQLLTFAPGFTDRQKLEYAHALKDTSRLDKKYLSYIQQPFAVQTANQIAGMFTGVTFTEEEADEANFKNEAAKYGIIHLGTHAEINPGSPLMSHLVLSKNLQNDSTEDGYLYAYEIYQMPLRAELAVLSACETGIGKQQKSEGIISLAHSFSYAGCPSIVMSLWNIDEKTTSGIILDFYSHLAEGMHKNKALRQAKLDYLSKAPHELRSPYYWAGLVLLGDHEPVVMQKNFDWKEKILVIIVVMVIAAFLMILWGKNRFRSDS